MRRAHTYTLSIDGRGVAWYNVPMMNTQDTTDRPADFLYPQRRVARATQTCVWCKGDATEFRDELSRREYAISHMCQTCQDEVFE